MLRLILILVLALLLLWILIRRHRVRERMSVERRKDLLQMKERAGTWGDPDRRP
jgi:uncharacterized membrane protein